MDENRIILYSTGCPKCGVLKKKLEAAGVAYEENFDVDEMKSLGMMSAPGLKVGEKMMNFAQALQWVNTYNGE